jgi:hypothetical protein
MAVPPDDSTPVPPPRRSSGSVPPFSAPRTGETPKQTPAPSRRPSTPLFVPPTALTEETAVPAAPPAPEPVTTPVAAAPPVEPARPTPPAQRETHSFAVENLETPEISLRITGERPAIGDTELQLISYDDANTGLQANAEPGTMPRFDGIELESTELSIEPTKNAGMTPSELKIESFWAAEAFTPTVRPDPAAESARPITPSTVDPVADLPPRRRSTVDSLRVEEVAPPRMQTPQSVRSVTPRPPSRTPTPMDIRTPAQLEALKELEPWALPSATPPDAGSMVADALERIARQIRSGELRMPSDAAASSDENALSAALQALVRAPRR